MAKDESMKRLAKYLEEIFNKDESIKARAIDGLAEIGESTVPYIIDQLKVNTLVEDKRKLSCVTDALTRIGQPAVPYLIKELKSWYEKVRLNVAIVLHKIGGPTAEATIRELLVKWLFEKGGELNRFALDVLGADESNIPLLIQAVRQWTRNDYGSSARFRHILGFKDLAITSNARIMAEPLIKMGKPAIPKLAEAIRNPDEDEGMRITVTLILGEIGDPEAIPILEEAIKYRVPHVPMAAILSLAKLGEPAVPILVKVMEFGPDISLSEQAEYSLVKVVGKASVPTLSKELISAFDNKWRRKVAKMLGEIGDPGAIPVLNNALNDRDKDVQKEAEKALKRCGG